MTHCQCTVKTFWVIYIHLLWFSYIDSLDEYQQIVEWYRLYNIKNQLKDRYHHLESLILGISRVLQWITTYGLSWRCFDFRWWVVVIKTTVVCDDAFGLHKVLFLKECFTLLGHEKSITLIFLQNPPYIKLLCTSYIAVAKEF